MNMQRMLFESHTGTISRDLYNPVQKWTKSISFTAYKTMKDTLNIVTDDSVWNMHNMRSLYTSYNMYFTTEEFLTTTRTNTHTNNPSVNPYSFNRRLTITLARNQTKKMPIIRSKHIRYTVDSFLRESTWYTVR